ERGDERGEWNKRLEGVVLDDEGAPAAGIPVWLAGPAGDGTIAARSDALGRFRLEDVDARSWVWADAEERLPSKRTFAASVVPGRELALRLGPEIGQRRGRITNALGRGVSGAEVTLLGRAV